jgi:hypothetical protein
MINKKAAPMAIIIVLIVLTTLQPPCGRFYQFNKIYLVRHKVILYLYGYK